MKKLMSILLVLLMLTSVLASCGGNDETTTTEAPTTEAPTTEAPTTEIPTTETPTTEAPTTEAPTTEAPTTEAPTTEAPAPDAPTPVQTWSSKTDIRDTWSGKTLNILCSAPYGLSLPWCVMELCVKDGEESIFGAKIDEAVLERQKFIKDTYGVELNWISAGGRIEETVSNATLAGNINYDIAMPEMTCAQRFVAEGYVYDLANREFIDFNNTYYSSESVNTYTAHGHTFFVTGDFSTLDKETANVLFFNKKLFKASTGEEAELLYDLVRKGEWTYDRYCSYVEAGYSDNGDSEWSETDTIGAYNVSFVGYFDYFGVKQAGVNKATGEWEITFNDDRIDDIISAKISAYTSVFFETAGGYGIFEDGLILFLTNQVKYANDIDMEDVGIVPFPMLNENQGRYYAPCSHGSSVLMCIPKLTQDRDMSEYFMDVLSWTARDYTMKAYLEQKSELFGTEAEMEMLTDYIIPNISYDAGVGTGEKWKDLLPSIKYDAWEDNENHFEDVYAEKEPKALETIAEWNKAWSSYIEDDPRPTQEVSVHTHTEVAILGKASTTTQTGLTEGVKCSECGKILKHQSVIPALEIINGLKYRLNEDNASYSVTGLGYYTDKNLIIPSEYNGLPVTKIEKDAFEYETLLMSVTIPSSVTSIGVSAFEGCTSITRVDFSEGVTYIGKHAFKGCTAIEEIKMPSSVLSTGVGVFRYCTSLKKIEISSGMKWISNNMLAGCTSLTTVIIPDSVTEIGIGVFYNCDSLTSVPMGNNVSIIGSGAFEDCDGFTEFTAHDKVTYIGKGAFKSCNGLKTLIIGSGVTYIHEHAFKDCTRLSYAEFIIDDGWGLVHLAQHIPVDVSDSYNMAGILSNGNGRPYLRKE